MSDRISIDRLNLAKLESARTLAERLISICLARHERIVTAESCTAGLLGQTLSGCVGASIAFDGGFLTYTKQAKTKMLGVSADLLKTHTAVHRLVAHAMADGALLRGPGTISLSVTGVTGDTPDEDGNPIGRVIMACATAHSTHSLHCEFGHLVSPALNQMAVAVTLALALQKLGDESVATIF